MSSFSISADHPSNLTVGLQDQRIPAISATQPISIVQVEPTEAQLAARSKLRELKVQAEQTLLSTANEKPHFIVIPVPSAEIATTDSFSHYAVRQMRRERERHQGATYLSRLIDVAYPTNHDESKYAQKIAEIKSQFHHYLTSQKEGEAPKQVHEVSARALHDVLRDLHVARLEEELRVARENREPWTLSEEEKGLFSTQLGPKKNLPLPERYEIFSLGNPKAFFAKEKMSLSRFETGSFSEAYEVISTEGTFPNNKYIFKLIRKPISQDPQIQFWRQQEFSIQRANGIANVVRTLFFIMSVRALGSTKHYLVPADELKIFGLHLPEGAEVKLEGQLMERAPGSSLNDLTKRNRSELSVEDVKNIAHGLFQSLSAMQTYNLVHEDLNLGNIFYDSTSKKVTIIDFGLAQRFRKKEKKDSSFTDSIFKFFRKRETEHYHFHRNPLQGNPTTRVEHLKTELRSPRTLDKAPHGSETDFFSYAAILLYLLNPTEFETAIYKKPANQRFLFSSDHPLESYLELVQQDDGKKIMYPSSRTKKILEEHPDLKKIIELAFQVSEGGEEGSRAFRELQENIEPPL